MTGMPEDRLATALKQAVPEPDPGADRASAARLRAGRLRRQRRLTVAGTVVAVLVAIGVPTSVFSLGEGSTTAPGPAHSGPAPEIPRRYAHYLPSASPSASGKGWTSYSPLPDPATVRAAIAKPLTLPTLAPGQACPVSPARTFPHGGAGFTGSVTAIGPGPLYMTGPVASGSIDLVQRRPGGWLWTKPIWVFAGGYQGPFLLRGGRIDQRGPLEFDHYLGAAHEDSGSTPHPQLLYVRNGLNAPTMAGLDSEPSGIYVKAPGCYAIQVDGQGFSETIVFRAVTRHASR